MGHPVSRARRRAAGRQDPDAHVRSGRERQGGDLTAPDYLVVGAGLTGATIAHSLSRAGHTVQVIDRRPHAAGNAFDYLDATGIRVHAHGPHYFRTSSKRIWDFVGQFDEFYRYEARVLTRVDGKLESWPIAGSYLRRLRGGPVPRGAQHRADNFEHAMKARVPAEAFDRFIRGYTEKQWGVPAHKLGAELANRIRVHWDDDPRLTPGARFQGLPRGGYAALVERMLERIPLELGVDYLKSREAIRPTRLTVFTGPIDEYFGFALGRLKYRGQRRDIRRHEGVDWYQPAAQINEPQHSAGEHIRTIEWKHLMPPADARKIAGTVVTRETPHSPSDPDQYEYPFPDDENRELYGRYRALAAQRPDVLICGRLGEYRYFDMDQAIGRALMWSRRILSGTIADARGA